jgi:hypothetical protein
MEIETNGLSTFLGGGNSVFIRVFFWEIFDFVPIFKKREKCIVGEIRSNMFPTMPIPPLPGGCSELCNNGTQHSVK